MTLGYIIMYTSLLKNERFMTTYVATPYFTILCMLSVVCILFLSRITKGNHLYEMDVCEQVDFIDNDWSFI